MGSFNKVILMGNMVRDAEVRHAGSSPVASFTIAASDRFKNKDGEWQERTEFVPCEMWGKRGEALAEHVRKGKPVFIEGKLQLDQWQDKDGNNRSKLKVLAYSFEFVDGGGKGESKPAPKREPESVGVGTIDDADIPFSPCVEWA